jgi:hypothetical protein
MSVESFYFCADLERASLWWTQPLDQTISNLKEWQPIDRSTHPWLPNMEEIIDGLIPKMEALKDEYPSQASLREACRMEVERFLGDNEKKIKSILSALRRKSSERDRAYEALKYVSYFYLSLVNAAWQGPANDPMNVRIVEDTFTEFLQRYMPEEEARYYHGSLNENLGGPCLPPELDQLSEKIHQRLQISMQPAGKVDATTWKPRWAKLETIPGLWEALGAETGQEVVSYLQAVEKIAGYALENKVAMLKLYM